MLGVPGVLVWLIVGGLAGWLAGKVFSGHGYGILGDVLLGIVGGFVGGFLLRTLLKMPVGFDLIGQFVISFVGAVVIVAIVHLVRREPL